MNPFDFSMPGQNPYAPSGPMAGMMPFIPPVGTGLPPPSPQVALPPSVTPEAVAGQLARFGIAPEQLNSFFNPTQSVGASFNPMSGAPTPTRGIGGEVARDAEASTLPPSATPTAGQAPKPAASQKSPFAGLSMPTTPQAQKVSTPSAPRPTGTIKQGELLALMDLLQNSSKLFQPLSLADAVR